MMRADAMNTTPLRTPSTQPGSRDDGDVGSGETWPELYADTGRFKPARSLQFRNVDGTAAPFRDRVVHHALINVIEAPIDRSFIHDSYACRVGKGVHRAVDRYQGWARRYRYVLKLDVARYFPSIDHDILKEKIRRHLKDRPTLELIDTIIDSSPGYPESPRYFPGDDLFTPIVRRAGIPIGNLTSQFFANLYLDAFDHFVKERLGAKAYLRYVDDMVLLDNDKGRLSELRDAIGARLQLDRLRLHPRKAEIMPVRVGVDVLGYRVFPNHRLLRNDNGHRFARKLRRYADGYGAGRLNFADFDPSVQSWLGHARHADTRGLRRTIFRAIPFRRGAGQTATSA